MRRSRDRGCEGHRILRRVLGGGRHLGSCRTISFHEQVETATLAASSRGKGLTPSRSATPNRETRPEGCAKALRLPTQRGRGDRDVRGSIGSGRRGKKTPTLLSPRSDTKRDGSRQQAKCVQLRSAEAGTSVVKHSVPRKSQGAQDSMRPPRDESRARSRERTRYGYTQIVQVAEVGRTHRASCPPGARKTSWRARALARRKLEAPPDAGTSREKAKRCAEWRSR